MKSNADTRTWKPRNSQAGEADGEWQPPLSK